MSTTYIPSTVSPLHSVDKQERQIYWLTVVILALGVGLATWQFLFNKEVWYDEALLFNNFVNRDFWGMFLPLDERQAAPILFLIIEKALFDIMPHKEFAVRALPFSLYLASCVLFFRLIHLVFQNPKVILLGAVLFSFNYYLIYYSSEAKQYMGDVFSILLMYYLILMGEKKGKQSLLLVGVLGIVMIYFSHVAPIILASSGLFLIRKVRSFARLKPYLLLFLTWAVFFVVYYLLFIKDNPVKPFMQRFWMVNYGFLPDFDNPQRLFIYFKLKFVMMFRWMLSMWTLEKYLMFILFVSGAGFLFYTKRLGWALLLFFPLLSHFMLSVLEIYPLELRLFLYYTPLLIFVIGFGFEEMGKVLSKRSKILANLFLVGVFLVSFSGIAKTFSSDFPIQKVNIISLMTFLERELKEGQVIFSYDVEGPSLRYYYSMGYWEDLRVVFVDYDIKEGDAGFQSIKEVTGPVWLVYEHYAPELHTLWEKTMLENGITIIRKQCFGESCGYEVEFKSGN